ncbi:MAG: hypothetical protein U5K81_04190 [Trueperaceae bacterium]|nr:hypothetical protein [Trueperaceae bacterium]
MKYAEAALALAAAKLAAMQPNTGRNTTLNAAAYSLGHKVASGHLDREAVERALLKAATDAGLPYLEAVRTLQSGLKAGMQEPWHGRLDDSGTTLEERKQRAMKDWR